MYKRQVIGPPEGIDKKIFEWADEVLSLSKMTFNYSLTLTILMEQIYRAISKNYNLRYEK